MNTLPCDIESEMNLIGSLLMDIRQYGECSQIMSADDLYSTNHQILWSAIRWYYENNQDISVNLPSYLNDREQLDQVGGLECLSELVQKVPHGLGAKRYAEAIKTKAVHRSMYQMVEDIQSILDDRTVSLSQEVDDLVSDIEGVVFRSTNRKTSAPVKMVGEISSQIASEMRKGIVADGVTTGYQTLNQMTNGFKPGELILLAGRPSMGKTALMGNMAFASAEQCPAIICSLEMSAVHITERFISSVSGVSQSEMQRRRLGDHDMMLIESAADRLKDTKIYIDDSSESRTVDRLASRLRWAVSQLGVKVAFIDYLQLINDPKRKNLYEEVTAISRDLKLLARNLNIPLVVLSQLSRAVENRDKNRPRMSDLRQSGSLEQDSDLILLIHRESYFDHDKEGHDDTGEPELIVAKNRNGPTGALYLSFDGSRSRFTEQSRPEPQF